MSLFCYRKEEKMVGDNKEVFFDIYCETCKYKDRPETANPCWDCLEQPVNVDSHKPVFWEKKDEK